MNAITSLQASKNIPLGPFFFSSAVFLSILTLLTQRKPAIGSHYSPLGEGTRRQGSVNQPEGRTENCAGFPSSSSGRRVTAAGLGADNRAGGLRGFIEAGRRS